jgi:hypothetical protein
MKEENGKKINYLDIRVLRKLTKFIFSWCGNPEAASIVIHSTSCHPTERGSKSL